MNPHRTIAVVWVRPHKPRRFAAMPAIRFSLKASKNGSPGAPRNPAITWAKRKLPRGVGWAQVALRNPSLITLIHSLSGISGHIRGRTQH